MLIELFKAKHSAQHFHDAVSGEESALDAATQAMEEFFAFHNNSSPLDQIDSRCEPDPIVTRDDVVKEGFIYPTLLVLAGKSQRSRISFPNLPGRVEISALSSDTTGPTCPTRENCRKFTKGGSRSSAFRLGLVKNK